MSEHGFFKGKKCNWSLEVKIFILITCNMHEYPLNSTWFIIKAMIKHLSNTPLPYIYNSIFIIGDCLNTA